MSGFCVTIPLARRDTVNSELEALGWGPGNFSIPLAVANAPVATHVALSHLANDPGFEADIDAVNGIVKTQGLFVAHMAAQGLERGPDFPGGG